MKTLAVVRRFDSAHLAPVSRAGRLAFRTHNNANLCELVVSGNQSGPPAILASLKNMRLPQYLTAQLLLIALPTASFATLAVIVPSNSGVVVASGFEEIPWKSSLRWW